MSQVNVKLTEQEEAILNLVPAEHRQAARQGLIDSKSKKAQAVLMMREVFSVSLSETVKNPDGTTKAGKGGYKVSGLGSRFPITLYPEQWETIFANADKIRACYNDPSNKAKSDKLRA